MLKKHHFPLLYTLMGLLVVSSLLSLLHYRQTATLLTRVQQHSVALLQAHYSTPLSRADTLSQAMLESLELAWLEVRDRPTGNWVGGAQGPHTPGWFSQLFHDQLRPLSLSTEAYTVNCQLTYASYRDGFVQTQLGLWLGTLVAGALLWLLSRQQMLCLERALVKQLESDNPADGPFPSITHCLGEQRRQLKEQRAAMQLHTDSLEIQVNEDALTGLASRQAFRRDLEVLLQDTEHPDYHCLVLVRASQLHPLNQLRGHAAGDNYLRHMAGILKRELHRFTTGRAYRLTGSDFALIIRQSSTSVPPQLGNALKQAFDSYQLQHELESVAYTGITLIRAGQEQEQVMTRADLALAKAQTNVVNGWYQQEGNGEDFLHGEGHWRPIIQQVIDNKAIMLMHQPVQPLHATGYGYSEIFVRFLGAQQQQLPTDTLLAMAQRHELLLPLEQLIIETIVQHYPVFSAPSQRWGINLSGQAMASAEFLIWLERLLQRDATLAADLVFEMDEELLSRNLPASIRLFEMLRRTGSRTCIAKFGNGLSSFRLFRELKPSYIKLDASLTDILERDNAGQQFVRMIVEVARRMGCQVIAEGVEQLAQKQVLEKLYVDAIQGYLVARPSVLVAATAARVDVSA